MTQWFKTKKNQHTTPTKTKRSTKEIEQEYANTAYSLGDTHFKSELERAKLQQLTIKLSELRDEHERAKEREAKMPNKAPVENLTTAGTTT